MRALEEVGGYMRGTVSLLPKKESTKRPAVLSLRPPKEVRARLEELGAKLGRALNPVGSTALKFGLDVWMGLDNVWAKIEAAREPGEEVAATVVRLVHLGLDSRKSRK